MQCEWVICISDKQEIVYGLSIDDISCDLGRPWKVKPKVTGASSISLELYGHGCQGQLLPGHHHVCVKYQIHAIMHAWKKWETDTQTDTNKHRDRQAQRRNRQYDSSS